LSPADVPAYRRKAELGVAGVADAENQGPFIYNPFAPKNTSAPADTLLIACEEVAIIFLLQNLFDIDIEIEWMNLESTGVNLNAFIRNVILGPCWTQAVQIHGVPQTTGKLQITGCTAKIKGCRARFFPIFKQQWKDREELKIKELGLKSATPVAERPLSMSSDSSHSQLLSVPAEPATSVVMANVVEPQPVLVLKSTSLHQSTITILEGERKTFTVTLQNISTSPVGSKRRCAGRVGEDSVHRLWHAGRGC
jgi:trafficking protein particle complex subunit 9